MGNAESVAAMFPMLHSAFIIPHCWSIGFMWVQYLLELRPALGWMTIRDRAGV
jgi:hypothetical protein